MNVASRDEEDPSIAYPSDPCVSAIHKINLPVVGLNAFDPAQLPIWGKTIRIDLFQRGDQNVAVPARVATSTS